MGTITYTDIIEIKKQLLKNFPIALLLKGIKQLLKILSNEKGNHTLHRGIIATSAFELFRLLESLGIVPTERARKNLHPLTIIDHNKVITLEEEKILFYLSKVYASKGKIESNDLLDTMLDKIISVTKKFLNNIVPLMKSFGKKKYPNKNIRHYEDILKFFFQDISDRHFSLINQFIRKIPQNLSTENFFNYITKKIDTIV